MNLRERSSSTTTSSLQSIRSSGCARMRSSMPATSSTRSSRRPAPTQQRSTPSAACRMPASRRSWSRATTAWRRPATRHRRSEVLERGYREGDLYVAHHNRYRRVELNDTVFHLIPNMLQGRGLPGGVRWDQGFRPAQTCSSPRSCEQLKRQATAHRRRARSWMRPFCRTGSTT